MVTRKGGVKLAISEETTEEQIRKPAGDRVVVPDLLPAIHFAPRYATDEVLALVEAAMASSAEPPAIVESEHDDQAARQTPPSATHSQPRLHAAIWRTTNQFTSFRRYYCSPPNYPCGYYYFVYEIFYCIGVQNCTRLASVLHSIWPD